MAIERQAIKNKSRHLIPNVISNYSKKSVSIILLVAFIFNQNFQTIDCESKEFDWSELGIARPNFSGVSPNNLRILVSPQRRVNKGYEFDYSNSTQSVASAPETAYVIPSSNGQYVAPASGASSGHSAAYNALSASLASLKSRLNARGTQLGDSSGSSSYGPSLTLDSQSQSQNGQAQASYLSVQSPQDHSSSGVGNSNSENKTIVLAIPAKINFLSENRSSSGYRQQPAGQQLTLIQPSGDQYYGKQVDDQSGSQSSGQAQDQQYMIVNSQGSAAGQAGSIIAGSINNGALSLAQGPIYQPPSSISAGSPSTYQAIAQPGAVSSYGVKYVPITYQAQQQQPQQSPVTQSSVSGPYEPVPSDQGATTRYISCPDTCNSSDPRWRKYSASRYRACCSRYSQYEPQYDQPSAVKVGETAQKYSDDAQYQYLYRRSRSRRSRRAKANRYNRYQASSGDDESANDSGSPTSGRQTNAGRPYHASYESPYMRYYRGRSQSSSDAGDRPESYSSSASSGYGKYPASKESRGYRRQRGRDQEGSDSVSSQEEGAEDDSSYGSDSSRTAVSGSYPPASGSEDTDEGRGMSYDDVPDSEVGSKAMSSLDSSDYPSDQSPDSAMTEESGESEVQTANRYTSSGSRRKKSSKGKSSRKQKDAKYNKRNRKSKYGKLDQSGRLNATDYESTQPGDHYPGSENGSSIQGNEDDQTLNQKESSNGDNNNDSIDKESNYYGNKHKGNWNESTVASLSKTTMHLKEILSMLEKKAQLRVNDTSISNMNGQTTTTSPPVTTTSQNPLSSLLDSYGSSSLSSALTSEFLSPDLSLKSPYRLEASSLPASLSSPSLTLPTSYSSYSSDPYGPLGAHFPSKYGLPGSKALPVPNVHHPRKRRPTKNVRYNNLMYPHSHSPLSGSSLLHAAKHPLLKSSLYSTLQYPYWYTRSASPSVTSFYPYKNVNKTPYSPLMYTLG